MKDQLAKTDEGFESATGIPAEVELEYVNCNLCGSDEHELLFQGRDRLLGLPGLFNVVQCRSCGLVFLNPRPTQASIGFYYPPEYPAYRSAEAQATKGGLRGRLIQFLKEVSQEQVPVVSGALRWLIWFRRRRWLKRRCPPLFSYGTGARVLDIGCGSGSFLATAKKVVHCEAYGVDISPEACAITQAHGINVHCGQLQEAAFPDEFFHVITLNHVLEHLPDPTCALGEIRRILRHDGCLFIAVPNAGGIGARLFGEAWLGWDVPRHVYGFTKATLTSMAKTGGFRTMRVRTVRTPNVFQRSLLWARKNLTCSPGRSAAWWRSHSALQLAKKGLMKFVCYHLLSLWLGDELRVTLRPRPEVLL